MIAPLDVLNYLTTYKWLAEDQVGKPEAVAEAIARFKAFAGLDDNDPFAVTESLEAVMALPRCEVPDFQMMRDSTAKWGKTHIRLHIGIGEIGGVPESQVKDTAWAAAQSWAAVSALTFEMVDRQDAADIWMARRPLPGPTLAWSYLPNAASHPPEKIEQRYDTTVRWREHGPQYLQGVMAHELGHALGLDHSRRGNLMQPFAESGLYAPQPGDIAEVVERYGKPRPKDTPTTPGTPAGEIVVATGVRVKAGRYTIVMRPE